jgi:DNA-binding transcriptional LysR family regulator
MNLRMPSGGLLTWEFEKDDREVKVRVDGRLVFNTSLMAHKAAVGGYGLAFLLEDRVQACLADGRLVQVLADWCPPFSGYHLYYPSRRQPTPAFSLLVVRCGIAVKQETRSSAQV